MSFADPQSITISGVTTSLPRTSVGKDASDYLSADGLIKLSAASAYGRRNRRTLRVDHRKVAVNPYETSLNQEFSMSNYIVFDIPKYGYTLAEAQAVWTGFITQVRLSSDALIVKLLGGES